MSKFSGKHDNLLFLIYLFFSNKIELNLSSFSEQCCTLISGYHKISCKTGSGVDEMFSDVANTLIENCRSRLDLNRLERQEESFKVFDDGGSPPHTGDDNCSC